MSRATKRAPWLLGWKPSLVTFSPKILWHTRVDDLERSVRDGDLVVTLPDAPARLRTQPEVVVNSPLHQYFTLIITDSRMNGTEVSVALCLVSLYIDTRIGQSMLRRAAETVLEQVCSNSRYNIVQSNINSAFAAQ